MNTKQKNPKQTENHKRRHKFMLKKFTFYLFLLFLVSNAIAQETAVFQSPWPEDKPFPTRNELTFPNGCAYSIIHDCDTDPDYQFLHETAVGWDGEELVLGWYQNPAEELIGKTFQRTARSRDDGKTWSEPKSVTERGNDDGLMYVGIQFLAHQGTFYAFSNQENGQEYPVNCLLLRYQQESQSWEELGPVAARFLSMQGPVRMDNGNWIISGSYNPTPGSQFGFMPAVYVSQGDNVTAEWKRYLIDTEFVNFYAETALIVEGSHITAITRLEEYPFPNFYVSDDYGRTWDKMPNHTFPTSRSKIAAGVLSNGIRYMIYNHPDFQRDAEGKPILDGMIRNRTVLAIALAFPGDTTFTQIYKLSDPTVSTEQAGSFYPCAVEHNGKLYVSYTGQHKKRNAALVVVPIQSLCPIQ